MECIVRRKRIGGGETKRRKMQPELQLKCTKHMQLQSCEKESFHKTLCSLLKTKYTFYCFQLRG